MSKRLESVLILGVPFEIRYEEMSDDNFGSTEGWSRVIKINKNLKGSVLADTILHESLHAILHVTGWSEKLGDKTEEGVVRALEHGLSTLVQFRKQT